mmetsp:Transcript_64452/g.127416  ORF Transcript_64452/g.127416 Transcript_64452/m.127416 type:complete len:235 (-) Transcript_64452:155-859(-)
MAPAARSCSMLLLLPPELRVAPPWRGVPEAPRETLPVLFIEARPLGRRILRDRGGRRFMLEMWWRLSLSTPGHSCGLSLPIGSSEGTVAAGDSLRLSRAFLTWPSCCDAALTEELSGKKSDPVLVAFAGETKSTIATLFGTSHGPAQRPEVSKAGSCSLSEMLQVRPQAGRSTENDSLSEMLTVRPRADRSTGRDSCTSAKSLVLGSTASSTAASLRSSESPSRSSSSAPEGGS